MRTTILAATLSAPLFVSACEAGPNERPPSGEGTSGGTPTGSEASGADVEPDSDGEVASGTSGSSTSGATSGLSAGASSGESGEPWVPVGVQDCATLDLPGFCLDVHNAEELDATRVDCPTQEVCRVVIHPGEYMMEDTVFTHHHWYRHFVGVLGENGERPRIESTGQAVFSNKGSSETMQHIVLQNLVLAGGAQGVDFSGAVGEPYHHQLMLSWLDNVRIEVTNRAILFNGNPAGDGHGSLWCTGCEIVNRPEDTFYGMIGIGAIDSVYFADTVLDSSDWSEMWSIGILAGSIGVDAVVDEAGVPIECGDRNIICADGKKPEYLRAPTLEWFESEIYSLR
ncbi:MAG: hypothetical protein ACRBN8_09660 [Nannocystales bacterium]